MADGQDYFIILLVLSVLLNFVFPVLVFLSPPFTYSGFLIIGFGFVLALKSRSLFLKNATTLQPSEEPTSLVISGPFRLSRNPIYLGMASILLGVAVLLGTLVTLIFPIIFIMLIEFFIIPGEEGKMEKIFGEPYRKYKKSVRRWI
ncbi:MAG: isoprenylcysteine carboxylmethyltransferase family protein [Methanoregula sp.]|jgi:protein-S-isoprenylcysteine O-methyltransferase Ste14|nr:isoprenylcysteine carboxylmethyltransferase family protein [Methanoregula sp.]